MRLVFWIGLGTLAEHLRRLRSVYDLLALYKGAYGGLELLSDRRP